MLATQSTGASNPSSSPDSDCHFFKLPPELRLNIYDEVLSAIDFADEANKNPITIRPPLFDACKLIRKEIAPMYGRFLIAKSLEVLSEGKDYLINTGHAQIAYSAIPGDRSTGLLVLQFVAYDVADSAFRIHCKLRRRVLQELAMLKDKFGCGSYRASYRRRMVAALDEFQEVHRALMSD